MALGSATTPETKGYTILARSNIISKVNLGRTMKSFISYPNHIAQKTTRVEQLSIRVTWKQ